jgi:phosphatidate cytidylyltransferase
MGQAQTDKARARAVRSREHVRKVLIALAMTLFTAGIIAADYYLIGLDILFGTMVIVVTIWCLREFYSMCESRGMSPFRRFGIFCGGLLAVVHWIALEGTLPWLAVRLGLAETAREWLRLGIDENLVRFGLIVSIFGALWLQATKRDNDRTFESISTTLFGILYVWFLSSFAVRIRHLGADGMSGGPDWNRVGSGLLLSCLVISKIADVGGYLFGRKFGRRRLIPRISPKKSYEGLVAGLALSVGSAFLLEYGGCLPLTTTWEVLVFALLVGGMGVLGDLAESLLKRASGRKDAGDYIPGFGGVLDVVDSVLLSAPVAYFLAVVFLRSHG